MSSVRVLKTLRVTDITSSSKHVYIVNNTKGVNKGNILISCPKTNGVGEDCILVEHTWIPLDLLEQVSLKQIMESSDFKKLVFNKSILLIPEEEAERLMTKTGYQEERDALAEKRRMGAAITQDNALNEDTVIQASSTLEMDVSQENQLKRERILVILESEEGVGQIGVVNALRNMEDELEEEDWRFIVKKAGKKGFKKVKGYASKRLAELLEGEDEEDDE